MNTSTFRAFVSTIRSRSCNLYNLSQVTRPINYTKTFEINKLVRGYCSLQANSLNHNALRNHTSLKFLSPTQSKITEQQKAGMKLVNNPKRRCKHCYIVIEDERKYVFCDKYPRHKQATLRPGPIMKVSKIMTHATQGGVKTSARMGMWTQQGLREDY